MTGAHAIPLVVTYVLPHVLTECPLQPVRTIANERPRAAVHVVKTIQPERQRLAGVADDDAEAGEAVERTTAQDREQVEARFGSKPPQRPFEPFLDIGRRHLWRRRLRVDIDRDLQRFGSLENVPEFRVVEETRLWYAS